MMDTPTFVVIAGQYQGGSTLLMRILNNFPGVRIYGENAFAFSHLVSYYEALKITDSMKHTQAMYEQNTAKPAWYNEMSIAEVRDQLRQMILNLYRRDPDRLYFGFKEIRYGQQTNYETMERSLKTMKEFMPEMKVVFVTRNRRPNNLKDAVYFSENKDISFFEYQNQLNFFIKFAAENSEYAYVIDYTDMLYQRPCVKFLKLFQFLNMKFDSIRLSNILKIKLR